MMKTSLKTILSAAIISFVCLHSTAQIKVKKPSVDVKIPTIGNGSSNDNNGSSVSLPSKDPSGLFSNCSDDVYAKSYRRDAVDMLQELESNIQLENVDYNILSKKIEKNEKSLTNLLKIEPRVNADEYNERYLPLKKQIEEGYIIFNKLKELEKIIAKDFSAPVDASKFHIPSYESFFSFQNECYCSRDEQTKSYQEYTGVKKEYDELALKLKGYKNQITQNYFTRMAECVEGGNKYALWVAIDNFNLEIKEFNDRKKPLEPNAVIEKCTKYEAALVLIENDKSLNLSTEAKSALFEAKNKTKAIKIEAERYINSGDLEKHKAKVHAEKIAKEFLPKAVATNAAVTSGAIKFMSGERVKNYFANLENQAPVATVLKANLITEKPLISKNELDIPKYKYHEIWVAFKDTDGRCYKVLVNAEYNYLGGGQYETTPTYAYFTLIEMACENVTK